MGRMKSIIDNLPEHVWETIRRYHFEYTHTNSVRMQAEIRDRAAGYVLGLRDAGLITEVERRVLFDYITI